MPTPSSRLACSLAALAVLATLVLTPSAAVAQDSYQLNGDNWEQQATLDPASPEGKLQAARKALAQGKGSKALKILKAWQKEYPDSPLIVEARLLAGDAKVAIKKYFDALYDYEYVIRYFPATEQFQTALEREYEIARMYVSGFKRKLLGLRILPADGEGEELLIRIQERIPGSELGEKASMTLADYYFERGEMVNASDAYDLFLINYPKSLQREWAMLRQMQASLGTFRGPEFDQSGLLDARERLRLYVAEFPSAAERIGADALAVRIEESLAQRNLYMADWYTKRRERVSAAVMYRRIVTDYPQTKAAQDALDRLAKMGLSLKED